MMPPEKGCWGAGAGEGFQLHWLVWGTYVGRAYGMFGWEETQGGVQDSSIPELWKTYRKSGGGGRECVTLCVCVNLKKGDGGTGMRDVGWDVGCGM